MPPVHKRYHEIERWKGMATEIADLGDHIVASIGAACRVEWSVSLPGLEDEFDNTADFRTAYGVDDLKQVETCVLTVRCNRPQPFVRVTWSREGDGVRATVRGENAVLVNGIYKELVDSLAGGKRMTSAFWAARALIVICGFVTEGVVLVLGTELVGLDIAVPAAIALPVVIIFGGIYVTGKLVPRLEILGPAEQSRWRASRAWALGAFGLVLLAILGPIFEAVFL